MRRLRRLSVRWRLATISAGLTFAILLLFAVVFGALTARQMRLSFDDDLRITAADLQERIKVEIGPQGPHLVGRAGDEVVQAAAAGDAAIRIVYPSGEVLAPGVQAPDLGPAAPGVRDVGEYRVVSRPLLGQLGEPVAFIQYGKRPESVRHTVARMKVFLALGVLGGTALALLGGLWLGRRAMAPIANLTQAAKHVARTRDPGVRLPKPEADDEVADLARTLEEMLMALDAARADTEAALSRQREFVADASHELRTPLTSILTNLEMLESELRGEDAEIAGSALRSSRRMRRLVADLLLLARADAGRQALREPVDLGWVAREAVAEAAPIAEGHDIEIDAPAVERGAPAAVVHGSADDLHRLALNLVQNAIAHTPVGTPVSMRVRREPGPGGEQVVLEVADGGPGVAPELRDRIFDRFVRGMGDRAGVAGSGLGLAIVRAVAESHGGSVALLDADGGGARFVVRLPAAAPAAAPEPAPAPAQTSTTTGSTIGRRLSRS